MNATQHDTDVLDQFTRQAEPFVQRHGYSKDPLLDLMAECAAVSREHTVLDVACGPGVVSCFFARRVRHVTGLDVVPAMIERAQRYQLEQQVSNVTWQLGSCIRLPFADGAFDCVVTRLSFHHFINPALALEEMKRVAKPGGVILVCDLAPRGEAQERFNHWETLRDPSHTRALTQTEFETLGDNAGLQLCRKENFSLERDLEDQLADSFPGPGDAERIRALFEADIQARTDTLGLSARRENNVNRLTFPVAVLAWRKGE